MVRNTTLCGLSLCFLCIFSASSSPAATGTVASMSPAAFAYGPGGGTGEIMVNATAAWSGTTENNWIMITSGSSFAASGTMSYTVSPNDTGKPRTGTIAVGNQYFTVRQPASDFGDNMDPAAWPYLNIEAISAAGITKGCGNNNFCIGDPVTREQMAAFIVRALNGENFTYTMGPYFTDVPTNSWSYPYVQKMKDLGLTTNTGSYDASGTVTREEMAAFIIRALYGENFEYPSTPYFTDVPPSAWSFKYVQKMKELGFTTSSGTYDASGIVTRDQMATFMSRAFLGMMPSSTSVASNNTAFMASMIVGKNMQFPVPNVGTMMYTFNEDGTFSATNMGGGMMNVSTYSGKWMINNDGTLSINNVQGMMLGYAETFTMVGGGGTLPPMVNYMNSIGGAGTNMMMTPK